MIFLLTICLVLFCVKKTIDKIVLVDVKFSGYDYRPINETSVNLYKIKTNFDKLKLLKQLQSDNVTNENKLQLIYSSHLLDELNANLITAPNYTKGLARF